MSQPRNPKGGAAARSAARGLTPEVEELLLQMLETELGGVTVYTTALRCALNEDLKTELEEYLDQTRVHVDVVTQLIEDLGVDPSKETAGRLVVRAKGEALVAAMESALAAAEPGAAQIVAMECVVDAESKDHLNWELLGELAKSMTGDARKAMTEAYEQVEEEEDEHLYHSVGWARELWIEHLGMEAVLPPPEEQKDVKTAIGAARAKQAREEMT